MVNWFYNKSHRTPRRIFDNKFSKIFYFNFRLFLAKITEFSKCVQFIYPKYLIGANFVKIGPVVLTLQLVMYIQTFILGFRVGPKNVYFQQKLKRDFVRLLYFLYTVVKWILHNYSYSITFSILCEETKINNMHYIGNSFQMLTTLYCYYLRVQGCESVSTYGLWTGKHC